MNTPNSRFEDIVGLVTSLLSTAPAIRHRILGRETAESIYPPVVVWEPIRAQYASARAIGTRIDGVRILAAKTLSIRAHCWGSTIADVEALEGIVITALREALSLQSGMPSSDWIQPDWADHGHVISISFDVHTYLHEAAYTWPQTLHTQPTARATTYAIDTAGAVLGDGVIQALEP